MSGGSFNYLCFKSGLDLGGMVPEMERMHAWLAAHADPASPTAAALTRLLATGVAAFVELGEAAIAGGLDDVWHDVEWAADGDVGRDDAVATTLAYEAKSAERGRDLARLFDRIRDTVSACRRVATDHVRPTRADREVHLRRLVSALDALRTEAERRLDDVRAGR